MFNVYLCNYKEHQLKIIFPLFSDALKEEEAKDKDGDNNAAMVDRLNRLNTFWPVFATGRLLKFAESNQLQVKIERKSGVYTCQ